MVGSDHEYDPFVPACSPLAHGYDTSMDATFDPMGVTGGIAPAPTYNSTLASQLAQAAQAAAQQAHHNHALAQQGLGNIGQGGWPSTAAQQWMTAQNSQAAQASTHTVTVIPVAEVTRRKISKLIEQLPMRVVVSISSINFRSEEPMRYEVVYNNMRTLEFLDVDEFPTDAHVSRVLLDSP